MSVTKTAYDQSVRDNDLSTRCMLAAFAHLGIPRTFADIGCGDGHLVRLAYKLGTYVAAGWDLHVPTDLSTNGIYIAEWDLEEAPIPACGQREMVICLEVAEHVSKAGEDNVVQSVLNLTAPGGIVLWSAAVPGQGGSGHVNEQPHQYWIDRFAAEGFDQYCANLNEVWLEVAPDAWWYGQNLLIFRRPLND